MPAPVPMPAPAPASMPMPMPMPMPMRELEPEPAGSRDEPERPEPRPWFQAQLMSSEETVLPVRRRPMGWMIAAGIAMFAGGVAGVCKFWEAQQPDRARNNPEVVRPVVRPAAARSEVLATARDRIAPEDLPPPAEEIPVTRPAPGPKAIARDVSTASHAPVPVLAAAPAALESRAAPAGPPEVSSNETPAPPSGMSEAERQIREAVPLSGYLEKPGTAMVRFFAATTWQERLKYSLAPDKVKPLMVDHYREHADGPLIPEDVELIRVEAVEEDPNRKYFAFNIFMPDVEAGIPLSVEETVNGCLVEWCSFIEGKDQLLTKFYAGHRKEPGTFRVLVRRGHYFDGDVPDQDRKEYFIARPPDGTGPFPLWADRDSTAYTRYFSTGERARWDVSSMMVLTLQWERSPGGVEYVRLRDVIADSWHPAMLPAGRGGK